MILFKQCAMHSLQTVAPHQPRLDWQMWFAALGSYQSNPWLVHLVYRLLIGQREGENVFTCACIWMVL